MSFGLGAICVVFWAQKTCLQSSRAFRQTDCVGLRECELRVAAPKQLRGITCLSHGKSGSGLVFQIITEIILDTISEHVTYRLGSMKKHTARKFSRALPKLRCQSFHRRLASRSLMLPTFAREDAYRIHGIGRRSPNLQEFHRRHEAVERPSVAK